MKKSFGPETLICPAPAWVVGTYDKNNKPNIMTIAWGGICCSKPPCVTVSLQKVRHSYDSIIERGAFTVNIASEHQVREVDYFGIVTGKNVNKVIAAGMVSTGSEIVDAPYCDDFPMVIECKLLQTVEIGSHTQFIGEILDIKVNEGMLTPEGMPDIEKIKPIIYSHSERSYFGIGKYLGKAFSIGNELK